jgi:hypothetical protein
MFWYNFFRLIYSVIFLIPIKKIIKVCPVQRSAGSEPLVENEVRECYFAIT